MRETNQPGWQEAPWPAWVKCPPTVLDTVDSTNTYALRLAREHQAPEGTLVIAEEQTAGRGRRERRWHSPRGLSIYASVVLRPSFAAPFAQLPTLLASAATAASLQHLYQLPARVKWPNDVQLEGKKLGGILTESVLSGQRIEFLVVGMGVNCNVSAEDWPEELRGKATAVAQELGHFIDRTQLLAQILKILGRDYALCQKGEYEVAMRGWRSLNVSLGRQVNLELADGTLQGTADELLPDGTMQLRESETGRMVNVRIGEVS